MIPSDPLYAQQWHFVGALGGISDPLGNIEKIWDEYSGAGIQSASMTTASLLTHPDLAANYDPSLRVIIDGTPIDGEPNATTPERAWDDGRRAHQRREQWRWRSSASPGDRPSRASICSIDSSDAYDDIIEYSTNW